MSAGEVATVIGKSMRIVGELSGEEDLVLEGDVQGIIRLTGARVTVGALGRIKGNVVARDVVILGQLEGDVRATGRVELRASAAVAGNIYAGTFSIEENAVFRGQIDPTRAQEALPVVDATILSSRATPLPAMLAAVANRTPHEPESARPTNLFAESEA